MSRFRRAAQGLASWYIILLANSVYVLASAPLAFHYLSKAEFGLWTVMSSIAFCLNLIDAGMAGAISRLLIDHKDRRAEGLYGSLIKTGWLVLLTQGVLVFVIGCSLATTLSSLLKIEPRLQADFVRLLCWQCGTLALSFAVRMFIQLLHAHQRVDIINYAQVGGFVINLSLLWLFFSEGGGVLSLSWATLLSFICSTLVCAAACWRLHLFPPAGAWGRPSWQLFKELFAYGKDVFAIMIGMQLIMSCQTMIVTSSLGLAAATVWNIGTRAFAMVFQALYRVVDASGPALCEMFVRDEHALLRERYKAIVMVSASLAGVAAVIFALCNSAFVTVWMHGQVTWPAGNDLLLGLSMIILAITHCHFVFVLVTKKFNFLRYIYLVEGLVFAGAALLAAPRGGLPAIIICALICCSLFSGCYTLWRVSRYFQLPLTEVGLHWLAPMARALIFFVPIALLVWVVVNRLEGTILDWLSSRFLGGRVPSGLVEARALIRLSLLAFLGGSFGAYSFLRFGLPQSFQQELLRRSPRALSVVLRRIFASAAQHEAAAIQARPS